eukprot:129397-Chlamydomonas_euryale.AAC.1
MPGGEQEPTHAPAGARRGARANARTCRCRKGCQESTKKNEIKTHLRPCAATDCVLHTHGDRAEQVWRRGYWDAVLDALLPS